MSFKAKVTCVSALVVSFSLLVAGQASSAGKVVADTKTAKVTGTVSDQTGAVIGGATITVKDAKGETSSAITNDVGIYIVKGLAAGTYSLTISSPGFKDFHTDNFTLNDGQELDLDGSLEPAGTSTSVNVEGQKAAQVETETAQLAGTITQKQLVSLGLNGRNFTQLIALTPGVSNQTGQDEAKVGIVGSVKYSVNGGRVEYNSFNVDGGDVINTGINGSESTLIVYPSLDALNEVKVLTSNYGAQYGRSASGTVVADTKSGTSQFHGVAYEFLRNELFNSRNFFDQTKSAPLYRRNDFGFTLGGPLFIPKVFNTHKDKTFFFFSEEFRLERTPTDYNVPVPSLAERIGNFSDVCPFASPGVNGEPGAKSTFTRSAYPDCPQSGQAQAADLQAGIPAKYFTFQGNQVPIDPTAQTLLDTGLIPAPNSTTGCNSPIGSCYDAVVSPNTYWREELFRIDQTISNKNRASFRYIHDSWDTTILTPQWGFVRNTFPTVQSRFVGPGLSMLARFTTTASPSLLNEFVFSYTTDHIKLTNDPDSPGQWQRPADLSLGYLVNNGFGGKVPGIVVGGTNTAYGGYGFAVDPGYLPWTHSNPTYNLRDDVSKIVGKHTLQFGVQVVKAQRNEVNVPVGPNTGDVQGLLSFSNISSPLSTYNSFADFILGAGGEKPDGPGGIQYFTQDSAQYKYHQQYLTAEPYFQDDWRLNNRLTLNLGLRVSLFGPWYERDNRVYNWVPSLYNKALAATAGVDYHTGVLVDTSGGCDPTDPNAAACPPIPLNLSNLDPRLTNGFQQCGVKGVPQSCMQGHLFNPAPRIGFAWDPWGDGKTSIRSGYGIFFHHGTGNEANTGSLEGSAPLVLNLVQNQPFDYACIGGIGPAPGGSACGGTGAYPLNITSIPTKAIWPYVQQWSLSVQREFPGNAVATLAYVGSKGTHLTAERQINQLVPVAPQNNPFAFGQPLTSDVCNSFDAGEFAIPNAGDPTQASTLITTSAPEFVNLEAACFGTPGKNFPDPNQLRTFAPNFGRIYSLENIADSHYNAMQFTLRKVKGPLDLGISYTYSHSTDDSSDRSDTTLVDSYHLATNYASSNFDQRHLINVSYIYQLPRLGRLKDFFVFLSKPDVDSASSSGKASEQNSSGGTQPKAQVVPPQPSSGRNWADTLFGGWEVSGITVIESGTPFSIINGAGASGVSVLDNAGVANGLGAGSYPDVVGDPHNIIPDHANNPESFGPALGDPSVFVAPRGLTFGNAGRNFFNNPRRTNFDMAILKHFKVTERTDLEFRAEAFNVFNHTQFRIYDPNIGNTGSNTVSCYGGAQNSAGDTSCLIGNAFLHPVGAHRPRTVQFGLKYAF